jgi:hypothetical protein
MPGPLSQSNLKNSLCLYFKALETVGRAARLSQRGAVGGVKFCRPAAQMAGEGPFADTPQTPPGKPPGAHPNSTGHRLWKLRRRVPLAARPWCSCRQPPAAALAPQNTPRTFLAIVSRQSCLSKGVKAPRQNSATRYELPSALGVARAADRASLPDHRSTSERGNNCGLG